MKAGAHPDLFDTAPVPGPAERWPRLSRTLPFARAIDVCQSCGKRAGEDTTTELTVPPEYRKDPGARRRLLLGGIERDVDGNELHAFARWAEHDDEDRIEPIAVALCERCAARIIEPHPRLYDRLPLLAPFPGAMGVCVGCPHNEHMRCTSPRAQFNGGPGLDFTQVAPSVAFLDGTRNGRRTGWRETWYSAPVTACSGRRPTLHTDERP